MEPQLVENFSDDKAEALQWSDVLEVIETTEMFWLSTVRRDGRPHVAPLPAIWLDGALHFGTGPAEQKAKNLEHNQNCALTTVTREYQATGVVLEGQARQVTDTETLRALARLWKKKLDWNYSAGDGVFINHDHHDMEIPVFEVRPVKVLAFGRHPDSQTRFTPSS
ncbi:pyridoxamine 5'-phosphate oxidase family protein [Streptomyces sp. SID13031]|uniref:pyridoxamine 5'-phosphate oxidase family protein n=1 Tax=Streptomyces sp. SID13031 TaxID=2706046 RepID=UPI0019443F3E|nr:pyridoxamine 5'-phosphate oxidase family protein [Streptomyces sp. SID13031]